MTIFQRQEASVVPGNVNRKQNCTTQMEITPFFILVISCLVRYIFKQCICLLFNLSKVLKMFPPAVQAGEHRKKRAYLKRLLSAAAFTGFSHQGHMQKKGADPQVLFLPLTSSLPISLHSITDGQCLAHHANDSQEKKVLFKRGSVFRSDLSSVFSRFAREM